MGLAGCLWFSIFPKVAVKLLAKAEVSSEVLTGEGIGFQFHSHGCWKEFSMMQISLEPMLFSMSFILCYNRHSATFQIALVLSDINC